MINRIIKDIEFSLDNGAYLSALSLLLMLPDICGKAEYPNEESNKKRYVQWYDAYPGKYERPPHRKEKLPYLSGEVIYSLRCSFLHQGNPNIENDKIKDDACKVDEFIIEVEKPKEHGIYFDMSIAATVTHADLSEETQKIYRLNLRSFAAALCFTAGEYWKKNKERFNFFNYQIVDLDMQSEWIKMMFGIG